MHPEILIDAAPLHIFVGVGPWHLHFFPRDGFASWSYRSFGLGKRVPIGFC